MGRGRRRQFPIITGRQISKIVVTSCGAGIHGPEPISPGPGPKKVERSRTRPDQDLKGLRNLGPTRTRNKYFPKISDQLGPGPNIFGNHGPTRTRTKYFRKSRTSSDRNQNLHEILNQLGPGPVDIKVYGPIWTRI